MATAVTLFSDDLLLQREMNERYTTQHEKPRELQRERSYELLLHGGDAVP